MKASANAPAKINLYLDVMQKRPDSFHDIKSIMHTVRLSDTVTVETKSGGGIQLFCSDPELPTDSRNLAYRAAELFFERTGINGACEIHIEKNIPVAGGLAGGSADAAAVLKLLNALCKEPLDQSALLRLGVLHFGRLRAVHGARRDQDAPARAARDSLRYCKRRRGSFYTRGIQNARQVLRRTSF